MDDILRETDAGYFETNMLPLGEEEMVHCTTETSHASQHQGNSRSPLGELGGNSSPSSPHSLRSPRSYGGGGGGGGGGDFLHTLSHGVQSERDQDNESTHSGFAFAHAEGRRTWTSERQNHN